MHRCRSRVFPLVTAVVLAVAAFTVAACAGVPSDPPSITGTVMTISEAGDGASILVAGSGEVDQASVFIDARTTLLRKTATGTSALLLADVKVGSRLSVWFEGPVAESYPVQAHAGTVLLLDTAAE